MTTRALLHLITVVACLARPSLLYASEAEVGLVAKTDPPNAKYYVLRRGRDGDVRIEQPIVLHVDDRIFLADLDARLTLDLIGEKNEIVISRHNDLPYQVTMPSRQEWPWLAWLVGELAPREEETRLQAAHIRGGGETLTLHLFDRPQRIAAGRRSLVIGWNLGEGAEVRIGVRSPGGKKVAEATTQERHWATPVVLWLPGVYVFEFNASGRKQTKRVEVAHGEPPRPSGARAGEEDLQKTIDAGMLAGKNDGSYTLEAFQIVAPLAERLPAAKLLRDALLDGAWGHTLP